MALYTQFQDPATYHLRREERRDEGLRSLLAMAMANKQWQAEQNWKERAMQIDQQRADAYSMTVAMNATDQTRWDQQLEAAKKYYDSIGRPDLFQKFAALGPGAMKEEQEWTFSPQEEAEVMDYFKMTPEQWESAGQKERVARFRSYYAAKRADKTKAETSQEKQRTIDGQLCDKNIQALSSEITRLEKERENLEIGDEASASKINNKIANLRKGIQELSDVRQGTAYFSTPLDQYQRDKLRYLGDVEKVAEDTYYYVYPPFGTGKRGEVPGSKGAASMPPDLKKPKAGIALPKELSTAASGLVGAAGLVGKLFGQTAPSARPSGDKAKAKEITIAGTLDARQLTGQNPTLFSMPDKPGKYFVRQNDGSIFEVVGL